MANFASANDLTNDAYTRGKVTINLLTATADAANNKTTITWNVVVSDGNTSYGGYNYNSPSGTGAYATGTLTASNGGTVSGTSSVNTGYQSYDFGSGVISSPYFPRTLGTYTATVTHSSSTGAASITGAAVLDGNDNPLGRASASTGAKALTTFTGPSIPAAPGVTRPTATSFLVTAATPSSVGSTAITKHQYRYSTDNVAWSAAADINDTFTTETKTGLVSTQQYYVQTRAISYAGVVDGWGYGEWSPSTLIAGVPSTPAAPTISNVVTTSLTLSWTAPADNGSAISSYTIQATTNGGTSWSNIATGVVATTYDLSNLTIAATYQFRIIAINSSGSSSFGDASVEQFISAYGYRFTSPTASVAIKTAARYTGSDADSVVVDGITYTKWKAIAEIKKYQSGSWVSLEQ